MLVLPSCEETGGACGHEQLKKRRRGEEEDPRRGEWRNGFSHHLT
jgi:hypothetical protein